MSEKRCYQPSNGTEGMYFTSKFCEQCIHEKFMHTGEAGDKQCDIFNRAFLHDKNDPEYPDEWTYDSEDKPTCTAWQKWDWGRNDDDDGWNDPPPPEPYDPNQLCLPFIFDDINPKENEQRENTIPGLVER